MRYIIAGVLEPLTNTLMLQPLQICCTDKCAFNKKRSINWLLTKSDFNFLGNNFFKYKTIISLYHITNFVAELLVMQRFLTSSQVDVLEFSWTHNKIAKIVSYISTYLHSLFFCLLLTDSHLCLPQIKYLGIL